ncbi:DNA adenine methylase [Campylobacter upsaliensis]|uniref:DNA adenine methylase n=1 Tax=Campylobacter upsaliensis TaxID=28080 RepID=UPI002149BBB5|nr:DNA adenine methylase [Campylobacter upsaliensis]MCR2111727.1 DNA adenine methylase [Campylobacter upsaliensis]
MFLLSSRRYTGAKTKLLNAIDESILQVFDYKIKKNLSFFDIFGGTGVVGEHFAKKKEFNKIIINDFLHSNFIIYQGFFTQEIFNLKKLENFKKEFANLRAKDIKENYYSKHYGGKFFSENDSKIIGYIRDELDKLFKQKMLNQKEFHILLSSLLYSVDRIANTVGHYDAYRKNVILQDRFSYELISPLKLEKSIEIYKEDSNVLAQNLLKQKRQIDIAFIDPPYNSRQYSRFYHLLENLALNKKPELYGVALKPKPTNLSKYCKVEAKEAFEDLIESLAKICRVLVVSYNNTYSANARSNARLSDREIMDILESRGKTQIFEYDFKPFTSGKGKLVNHKERIFICLTQR